MIYDTVNDAIGLAHRKHAPLSEKDWHAIASASLRPPAPHETALPQVREYARNSCSIHPDQSCKFSGSNALGVLFEVV